MSTISNVGTISKTNTKSKKLSLMDLYYLGVGQVIGAGVITLIGPAIADTGWSAWFAFLMAVLYGFAIVLPLVFITSTVALKGGYYSMVTVFTKNKTLSGMYSVALLTKLFAVSLTARSLGTYIKSLAPDLSTTNIILFEIAFLSLFFFLNLLGIKSVAKVQKYFTWFLIISLAVFAVWGMTHYTNPIFDIGNQNFMTNGIAGLWVATLSLEYCTTGYARLVEFGAAAEHPTRDIPRALIMTMLTILVIYVGVAMANTTVLPLEEVAGKPLTSTALAIFPRVLFVAFIVGGPIMALLTTLNGTIASQVIPIARAAEDGWLPKWMADKNKYGARWKLLLLYFLIGLVPLSLNLSVKVITQNIQLLNTFLSCMFMYSYWFMPKAFPEAWKKSKFHVPDHVYKGFVILCMGLNLTIMITNLVTLSSKIVIISCSVTAACLLYGYIRSKDPKIDVTKYHNNIWTVDDVDDDSVTE